MTDWELRARFLWDLLDDIDTLDDACKDDDAEFRSRARAVQRKRFIISESDGYTVQFFSPTPAKGAGHEGETNG